MRNGYKGWVLRHSRLEDYEKIKLKFSIFKGFDNIKYYTRQHTDVRY